MLSIILFTVGALVASLANNFRELLAGRTVQGVGGGGIISLTLVIFSDIIPLRLRPKYWTFIQATWGIGMILGPLVGGLFAQHATWRWAFYINFPFCGAGLMIVPFVVTMKTKKRSLRKKMLRVDWVGAALFNASLTALLIAITWGGVQYSWESFQTFLPLILGVLGILAALAWEKWVAKHPFLRLGLFNSRSAFAIYVGAVFQGLLVRDRLLLDSGFTNRD